MQLSQSVLMPNGSTATVTAKTALYGYHATLHCTGGGTLPCSFGAVEPTSLEHALALAVAFVERVNAASVAPVASPPPTEPTPARKAPREVRDTEWNYTGDVNFLDYGGKWIRRTAARQFQVIEITNMTEAVGERENEGHPTYVVELSLVDLDAIPAKEQTSALQSCGQEDDPSDLWRAVACFEYGCKAPLDSWEGNGATRLLRDARGAAKAYRVADVLDERMQRPVNAIGSTAAEYMCGDVLSGVLRGVSVGDPKAELMLKLGVGR